MAYGTIGISEPHCSNLKEIMRAVADQYDGGEEIVNVHRYAARCIVNDYLDQFPDEKFSEMENGQIVYLGGDSLKTNTVAKDNDQPDDGDDGDDGALTFTMSEGPPSSDD